MAKWLQKVVGESFGNRQSVLASLSSGELVELKREPDNPYDKNAVAILTPKGEIGYIPRDEAARFSKDIFNGVPYRAWIHSIHGGDDGYSFGAVLIIHSKGDVSEKPDFTTGSSLESREDASGCLGLFLILPFMGAGLQLLPDIFT